MTFPPAPEIHALAVMALTVGALFLFTRERVPLEATSLFILIALAAGFQFFPLPTGGASLTPADFLAGFGHEALITICALMIIGQSLEATGALEPWRASWRARLRAIRRFRCSRRWCSPAS